jgi:hypothetical protein
VNVAANAAYLVGTPATATVTIVDDEIGISVTKIIDAGEGGPVGIFRVCRTGSATGALAVNGVFSGTATSPADYSASGITGGVITIVDGAGCADVSITAVNDATPNPDRTVILTISSQGPPVMVVPGQGAATMFIVDNDAPKTIPTLSEWMLALLALMLAGFGMRAQQRRRN